MAKIVSKTYGDALFSLALEENRLDEFYKASSELLCAWNEHTEFGELMRHPQFTKEEKTKIMEETFANMLPKEMVGMLILLVKKGHVSEIPSVFEYFIKLVKEEKKIGEAYVTSAVELTDVQKEKIEKKLLETTKYETFEMNYAVDSTLIGGLVIRIGDRIVDSTVKTKLYELTRNLRDVQV